MVSLFNPSPGAVMIVKDAEETVIRAIASLRPFCSEIVIVDTGSSDRTPEICQNAGAELYFFQWPGSFSEARNHALRLCRAEWLIAIDADEELSNFPIAQIRHLLADKNIGGLNVRIRNLLGDKSDSVQTTHYYTRIFRNRKDIRYTGRIHEQIRPSILEAGLEIVETDIEILHHGYSEFSKDKAGRNKKMIEEELAEHPGDPWLRYHLGDTEFSLGNIQKAREIFGDIHESAELSQEQREHTRIRLGQTALASDDYDAVDQWLDFQSRDIDTEGLRLFVLAGAMLARKRFAEAKALYGRQEIQWSSAVDKSRLEEAINLLDQVM